MIYASLALVVPALWFLGWWSLIPIAFAFGYLDQGKRGVVFAAGSALAWTALALLADLELAGRVSSRLSRMFSFPFSGGIFLVVAIIAFLTALFWFHAGREVKVLLNRRTNS